MGIRVAILNLRQQEEAHIMENIIYNELRMRDYCVDMGVVETWTTMRLPLEIDFVVNKGAECIYIQSAYRMPNEEKEKQEKRSLLSTNDYSRKNIITCDDIKKTDEQGIVTIGLLDFLLTTHSI